MPLREHAFDLLSPLDLLFVRKAKPSQISSANFKSIKEYKRPSSPLLSLTLSKTPDESALKTAKPKARVLFLAKALAGGNNH